MKQKNAYVHFNCNRLMPQSSKLCGEYSVYWLMTRYQNFDLDFFEFCALLKFKSEIELNDSLVKSYIENEQRILDIQ